MDRKAPLAPKLAQRMHGKPLALRVVARQWVRRKWDGDAHAKLQLASGASSASRPI